MICGDIASLSTHAVGLLLEGYYDITYLLIKHAMNSKISLNTH